MKSNRRKLFSQIIIYVIVIAVLVGATILFWPIFQQASTHSGRLALTESIKSSGPLGVLLLLGAQILQIVIAVIPGEFTQIVAGAVYGTFFGALIILIGAEIATLIVFLIVRKLGEPIVKRAIGEKNFNKLNIINDPKSRNSVILVLYMIPGFPKDAITYLAPLTSISLIDFMVVSTIGRTPAIFLSTYLSSVVVRGTWQQFLIVSLLYAVVAIFLFIFRTPITEGIERGLSKIGIKSKDEEIK